jgi:hypothetical protein
VLNVYRGICGTNLKPTQQVFKILLTTDESNNTGHLVVSSYETELTDNEVNSADFIRVERAVSDFGLSTEEFLPVMINNSDLTTSETLSNHFKALTFLAADRKEVFDFA